MKQKKDFILLIMNCEKYKYKATHQKNTWLKTLPNNIIYYHVLGNKTICKENKFVFDEKENILYVNTKDDYNSLPSKVIHAFYAIHKQFDYKYIFKTDDDQILYKKNYFTNITKLLLSKQPISYYGGFSLTVNTHISNYHMVHKCLPKQLLLEKTTYCNGRFYFLYHEAIENLIQKMDKISKKIIEDHAIGYYLDDNFKINLLHFDTKKIFVDC